MFTDHQVIKKERFESFINNNKNMLSGIVFTENMNEIISTIAEINQDIKFINIYTWKVYEHYTINGVNTLNYLGFFNATFQYNSIIKLPFSERRANFQGSSIVRVVMIDFTRR